MTARGMWWLLASAMICAGHPAAAVDGLSLDYRDVKFRMATPGINAADTEKIGAALAGVSSAAVRALGSEPVVLGEARGTMGKTGPADFYLLSGKPPVAIEPFPDAPAQVILAIREGQAIKTYVLPKEVQYSRIVGAVDMDEDGLSEVLLEASAMNMGEIHTSVSAIRLEARNTARPVQTLDDVYLDTCEAPHGDKLRSAKMVRLQGAELTGEATAERCN